LDNTLLYDGIVFNLQRTGGISVLYSEIISRLPRSSYELVGFRPDPPTALAGSTYTYQAPRRLEKYRRAAYGGKAEVFHSTYYRLPAERGAAVVTTVYDFVYERFHSLPQRIVHGLQKRTAIAGADRIICISESTRRDLLEGVGHQYRDRTVVVPLAASEAFHPLPGVRPLPQVLFVGPRAHYKNFPAVVDALESLPDLLLLCVGGGELTANERTLLDRKLPGRYKGAGYISVEELNLEYNRSLCLAYPSLHEGFGIPVLEAMRAGCPVVAVNMSSIPEVAGDAAVLLERGDADEIRSGIQSLSVTAARAAIVARGLSRAGMFTWDETYRRTVAVYEELIGHSLAE
jgi:mannosyltransferase